MSGKLRKGQASLELAHRFRAQRERLELSQDDFAKKYGFTRRQVQTWELGEVHLPYEAKELLKKLEYGDDLVPIGHLPIPNDLKESAADVLRAKILTKCAAGLLEKEEEHLLQAFRRMNRGLHVDLQNVRATIDVEDLARWAREAIEETFGSFVQPLTGSLLDKKRH